MNGLACAGFLLVAFVLAGFAQTAWFASPLSRRFARPLDGGLTVRGRRLLGDNKTLRGFLVMIPATAASFAFVSSARGCPACAGLWPLTPGEYLVNVWVGDSDDWVDAVVDAARLTLLPADYLGTGRLPPRRCGPLLVKGSWSTV